MKILTFLMAVIFLSGVGIAQAAQTHANYTPEQIKEMPRFSSIENQRCPKSRYPLFNKRMECKHEVRVGIYEKRKAREEAESNQSNEL